MKPTSKRQVFRIIPIACLVLAGIGWGQARTGTAPSGTVAPAPSPASAQGPTTGTAAGGDTLDTSTPAPAGMAPASIDAAGPERAPDGGRGAGPGDSITAEAVAPEPSQGAFLVPIDGDVFYEPALRVLATLPVAPFSVVLLLDGYPEAQPLTLNEGTVRAELAGLKSGVHELTLLLFNERTEIIARQSVRFFVRVPESERKPRNGKVRQYGHVVAKLDWKNGEAQGRVLSQKELKLDSPADTALAPGKSEKPISQEYDGVAEAAYSVKYRQFEGYGKVLARTDENRFRQPSDRIVANVKYGPWASLKAGDVYPLYNPLLLNGTRVRGAEAGLNLTLGETTWGSLRAVRGASRREVPAYLVEYDTGNGTRVDTVAGTFAQTLTAVRLGIGGGPSFDMGFTLMKASDDEGGGDHYRINSLLHGPRPAENLVPGIDLRIGAWDGRIQLYVNSALSLYTRDRSLGAFHPDSFDVAFNPQRFEDVFVFNSTTRGWQYLLSERNGAESDVGGFIGASSALESGIVSSIPLGSMVEEFELRYSHLGLEYHSEGNPFLGANPGDGFTAIEKLSVLDNRVSVAMELGQYGQDLGLTSQLQRTLKVDLRFTPGPYQPSFWIGGGRSNIVPEGTYAHQFSSSFLNFNTGAYHQFQLPDAKLHATLLYGFTESEYALQSAYADDTLDDFPTTDTHIVNAMAQYKMRGVGFLPRLAYTFSSNGIQQPTHAVSMGFQQPLLEDRVKVDLSGTVGQYPKSNDVNDVSFGAAADVEYVLGPQQTFRLREKFLHYGDRRHLLVGANYELYF